MTDKKASATEVVLKDEIIELSKKFTDGITLDAKTGVGAEAGEIYNSNLPDGVTPETVKTISKYNADFIAAGAYAFGTMSVAAMAKQKDLEKASVEVKMGHRDAVTFTVDRKKEYTNHLAGGEKSVKHGVITASYEVRAGKNSGSLKTARELVSDLAMKKLR